MAAFDHDGWTVAIGQVLSATFLHVPSTEMELKYPTVFHALFSVLPCGLSLGRVP